MLLPRIKISIRSNLGQRYVSANLLSSYLAYSPDTPRLNMKSPSIKSNYARGNKRRALLFAVPVDFWKFHRSAPNVRAAVRNVPLSTALSARLVIDRNKIQIGCFSTHRRRVRHPGKFSETSRTMPGDLNTTLGGRKNFPGVVIQITVVTIERHG